MTTSGRWCHSWYAERGTRLPFCITQNAKWTNSEKNKQGFALDVIFQNETVYNFWVRKNVLLLFHEAWNAYFIFRELWKDRFIFRETWSRPPPPPPLYTLLSGISKANDVYFWLGMADSTNGRQGDWYGWDQVVKKFVLQFCALAFCITLTSFISLFAIVFTRWRIEQIFLRL